MQCHVGETLLSPSATCARARSIHQLRWVINLEVVLEPRFFAENQALKNRIHFKEGRKFSRRDAGSDWCKVGTNPDEPSMWKLCWSLAFRRKLGSQALDDWFVLDFGGQGAEDNGMGPCRMWMEDDAVPLLDFVWRDSGCQWRRRRPLMEIKPPSERRCLVNQDLENLCFVIRVYFIIFLQCILSCFICGHFLLRSGASLFLSGSH
jgi:hypothetical protein